MPTASNRGWPTTTAELGPWAATFDSRLQPYLEWFGTVVVACTGQPDRLEVEARLWERSAREWNAVHARLTDSLPIVDGWQGAAAQTFRGTHRERLTRIEAESRRIPLVPKALRTAHYGLVVGRRDAIRVTTRFLTAVRARTASISAATPALAATMTTEVVQDTFAFYQPDALKVVAALRATMKRLALQLEAATPDPGALARWFAPELTRRGLNLVKDHEMPLGWEQTVPFEQGARELAAAYRAAGLL